MGSYNIYFKPSVQKDLRRIPEATVVRVIKYIEGLAQDPRPRQSIKMLGAERLYRLRVGDYRIIYEIDKGARQVTIHYIRHRKEVYKK